MTDTLAAEIERIRGNAFEPFGVSGMVVGVAQGESPVTCVCWGTDAAGHSLTRDTLFPVASITKLAVALAILRLVDRHSLGLDDLVAAHLPEAACAPYAITIRHLLSHTSGLPDSYPEEPQLYRLGLTWPVIAQACLRTEPESAPGTRVRYSGVGYSLLALIVERLTGQPFSTALTTLVLDPLGVEGYLGVEPPRSPAVIDVGDSLFAGTDLEFYNSAFFRSLGEPAGGLLTTVDGALRLVGAYRGFPGDFLRPGLVSDATSNQTGRLGGGVEGWFDLPRCPWGLGPGLKGTFPPLAPSEASARSFGHSGASGCFVWCDPDAGIAWAILGTSMAGGGWSEQTFPAIGAAILRSS